MPILYDHYLIVPHKDLHSVFDASAKKKTVAMRHALDLAKKTNKIIVIVRVVEIVTPQQAAEHNAHLTLGESATSQTVFNAEAVSASDGVPPSAPAQVA